MASSTESSASVSKSSSVVSLPDAGINSGPSNHEIARDTENENEQPKVKSVRLNESTSSNCDETTDDQSTSGFKFSTEPSLERLRHLQSEFIDERNWQQWQTPRNLLLALVGEVGELSEIFQWKGEVPVGLPNWSDQEKDHLGQEMADVLIYLIRLADQCHIDLPAAALNKMAMNRAKYPADKFYGSSRKYNQ